MKFSLFFAFLFVISQSWAQDKAKIEKLLEFVKVEGGTFTMGSAEIKDAPLHQVELSTFYIQKTEVTQELWEAVMGSNPSRVQISKDYPVTHVNWNDCQKFIKKLNTLTGKKYRLPTEAEWEYAARGGNQSKGYRYSGSNDINEVAWYQENSNRETHPVKEKKPNELGLYDMSGNVFEWCADWYGDYRLKVQKAPVGPANGKFKVMRGGSWNYYAMNSLVANRVSRNRDREYNYDGGLRLCSSVK
jgi:formylglycine-generating enzyme required for sulfatase activity